MFGLSVELTVKKGVQGPCADNYCSPKQNTVWQHENMFRTASRTQVELYLGYHSIVERVFNIVFFVESSRVELEEYEHRRDESRRDWCSWDRNRGIWALLLITEMLSATRWIWLINNNNNNNNNNSLDTHSTHPLRLETSTSTECTNEREHGYDFGKWLEIFSSGFWVSYNTVYSGLCECNEHNTL